MGERVWNSTTAEERERWGPGPWDSEPSKVQWVDAYSGLDCLVVRNRHGSLCGYVGLPPGHPYHGADYSDVDVDVHGGLTYADSCQEEGPEDRRVCHVLEPGRPDDVWWLGFDCGHYMDLSPGVAAFERELGLGERLDFEGLRPVYRDMAYVRTEVMNLAKQLALPTLPARGT
jgi:hypothetical protein